MFGLIAVSVEKKSSMSARCIEMVRYFARLVRTVDTVDLLVIVLKVERTGNHADDATNAQTATVVGG